MAGLPSLPIYPTYYSYSISCTKWVTDIPQKRAFGAPLKPSVPLLPRNKESFSYLYSRYTAQLLPPQLLKVFRKWDVEARIAYSEAATESKLYIYAGMAWSWNGTLYGQENRTMHTYLLNTTGFLLYLRWERTSRRQRTDCSLAEHSSNLHIDKEIGIVFQLDGR